MGAPGTTPGEWLLEGGDGLLSVAMSHEKAWMHFNPSVSSFGYDPTAEMRANAHQIAASGKLYDALEHILSGALSLPRFAEEEARIALALARGEQS